MKRFLSNHLSRFSREDSGTLTVEAVLILPILVWWWVASLVFFDAFHARNVNQKAAYTISDMISREMGASPMNSSYIEGLGAVYAYLTAGHGSNSTIRVTELYCEESCELNSADRVLLVDWSYSTDSKPILTNETIADFEDQIPVMTRADRAIMVETFMDYTPAFNVGMDPGNYQNLIVTRLRFAPRLCWNECEEGAGL